MAKVLLWVKWEQRRKNPSQKLKPPATISKNDWRLHIDNQSAGELIQKKNGEPPTTQRKKKSEKWEAFCEVTLRIYTRPFLNGRDEHKYNHIIDVYCLRLGHVYPRHAACTLTERLVRVHCASLFNIRVIFDVRTAHPKSRIKSRKQPSAETSQPRHMIYIHI